MPSKKDQTLERLVKAVERAYDNPSRMMWLNFWSGVAKGLGTTVGAAVIVIITGWILTKAGVFDDVKSWLESINLLQ